LALPTDVPLNRLLRESQIPHRLPVSHGVSECRPFTRMQLRVLDHRRLLESMKLGAEVSGKAVVAIHEIEGGSSRVRIDVDRGRISASSSEASADVEMSDRTWAALVCGDWPAKVAAAMGFVD